MLKRCFVRLAFKIKDVKTKLILDRARSKKEKQGVPSDDIDDEDLARECNLVDSYLISTEDLIAQKERLLLMLKEQKLKRISQREAFLAWQTKQREKGAAHRLDRQARTSERYKQHHYHSQKGRILPIAHFKGDKETNDKYDWKSAGAKLCSSRECVSSTEFLVEENQRNPYTVFLSLSKR
ncbi:unnamed protein product [Phytomonas sp. Hart1]|nr:unnamed protein product [Phytomonas sp. Hart1]|eukprot:CCW68237.1 unnamed protein product [Phytomonas sp. isolate Hart1]